MIFIVFIFFSLFQRHLAAESTQFEDAYLQTPEIIEKYGYRAETLHVVTKDGYILTVHRIPYSKNKLDYKGVVILQHGLLASSAAWVVSGPNVGFAFLLNNAGFDVWMPNLRGNHYSRSHKKMSPEDAKFWDFSWHEAGVFDLPAVIDYALNETGAKDLIYIGHSMGTTVSYVLLSMKPEYNKKIRLVYSLGPASKIPNSRAWAATGFSLIAKFRTILKTVKVNEVGTKTFPDTDSRVKFCAPDATTHEVCKYLIFYSSGTLKEHINSTNLPIIAGHTPAGCSLDMMAHFGQGIASNEFSRFDYGPVANLRKYGRLKPPKYNLGNISTKVIIYYGETDTLTVPKDVIALASELPNLEYIHQVPGFGHNDFNYALDADKYVYIPIIQSLLKEHNDDS